MLTRHSTMFVTQCFSVDSCLATPLQGFVTEVLSCIKCKYSKLLCTSLWQRWHTGYSAHFCITVHCRKKCRVETSALFFQEIGSREYDMGLWELTGSVRTPAAALCQFKPSDCAAGQANRNKNQATWLTGSAEQISIHEFQTFAFCIIHLSALFEFMKYFAYLEMVHEKCFLPNHS